MSLVEQYCEGLVQPAHGEQSHALGIRRRLPRVHITTQQRARHPGLDYQYVLIALHPRGPASPLTLTPSSAHLTRSATTRVWKRWATARRTTSPDSGSTDCNPTTTRGWENQARQASIRSVAAMHP